jgi:hypothetical protein
MDLRTVFLINSPEVRSVIVRSSMTDPSRTHVKCSSDGFVCWAITNDIEISRLQPNNRSFDYTFEISFINIIRYNS